MASSVSKEHTVLRAYCAVCGVQRPDADLPDRLYGQRYRCASGSVEQGHVAAVVQEKVFPWIRFAGALARYQEVRWFPRNWLFRGRTEAYILGTVALLCGSLLFMPVTWWPLSLLVGAFALDVVIYSVSVAFVTQGPHLPVRTVILTLAGFVQIVTAFAVVYRTLATPTFGTPPWFVGSTARNLSRVEALYFSVVTMATVGFGDIRPNDGAHVAQLLVLLQICLGLVFLACVLAAVVSWAGGMSTQSLDELMEPLGRRTSA